MKELLAILSLFALGAAEPPAPYPASGWRPSGPAFELPQRGQAQQPQSQEYLPPVDPRNKPSNEYGVPEEDVSVQGLPGRDQQIFQQSPIHGFPVSGPGLNSDIRNLDQALNQNQYQQQQETYRQFQRQQFEASQINNDFDRLPRPQPPRKFAQTPRTTQPPTTTEAAITQATDANLNERELLEDSEPVSAKQTKSKKVSVEITRQNLQEYPGELFLSSLAQLQLQPQFVPLQQVRSPVVLQQVQEQKQGFDGPTHFAAFPSVLAQQQLQNQYQNSALLVANQPANPELVQPAAQYQPVNYQSAQQQNFVPPSNPDAETVAVQQPVPQYQPANYQPQAFPQFQPQPLQPQFQPVAFPPSPQFQPVSVPQLQPVLPQQQLQTVLQPQPQLQPVAIQPQTLQPQPQYQPSFQPQEPKQFTQKPDREELDENYNQNQQPLYQQPLQPIQYQPDQNIYPAQLIVQDLSQYQQQFLQPQVQSFEGQDSLQSGLDVNQEGNDIDQAEDKEEDEPKATAVATVFGTRTQPRVFTQYGAPFPVPKVQAEATTTESPVEEVTEDGPAIAQAIAVANPSKRKSARLRSRRLRPVVGVDRSGRLVYAEQ